MLALPGEAAAETALRTQQVIMEETGVTNVSDPLGGSWYVEALTDRLEAEAEAIFARIREMSSDGSMTDGIHAEETFQVHALKALLSDDRVREALPGAEDVLDRALASPATNYWNPDLP